MFDPADIYLDFAAACPKRPEVAALHERRCARFVANPHGTGRFGTDARRAIEKAEAEVLDLLAIPRDEATVVWTSGGTEAANLAIFGTAGKTGKASIAVSATAHTCLLEPADATVGARNVRRLPVDTSGQINLRKAAAMGCAKATLLGCCHVNNETGVVLDPVRLRDWMREHAPRARLLVDALQSAGKLPIPWREASIDMLMVGGRKIGGPASGGCLIVRNDVKLAPRFYGGGQQRGVRPGTVDVVAALEMAQALRMQCAEAEQERRRIAALNEHLREALTTKLNGHHCHLVSPKNAAPWILCCAFDGYEGAILTRVLGGRGIAVSAGSACSAEAEHTSHVLRAMAVPEPTARGMVRISLGYTTTEQHIDRFVAELRDALDQY